ncbi:response regulator [Pseudopedobacter beijingensis]|uniref:Response regulator n=1 Tax=Pseudopedobacter beijingensis TaxID=1207056 RepID=A0ABW4IB19_9SPHI
MNTPIRNAFIIDDDDIYIFGIKKLLQIKSLCEQLTIFNSATEAISKLEASIKQGEDFPEIILLDINMPLMSGWEFMEKFKEFAPEHRKNTKLYMVSSSIDPDDLEKAGNIPEVTKYLIKPINLDILIEIFTP